MPRLTSSINYSNRESTLASWQLDEKFDPQTNGNFRRTDLTQVGDQWVDFSANNPSTLSSINQSRQVHDLTAPTKPNQSNQFRNKQTKSYGRRLTISKAGHIVS